MLERNKVGDVFQGWGSRRSIQLGFILLIALALRIWALDADPNGFLCDEASIGYNAYSILRTARDEHGIFLPLFPEAFGEFKNPVAIYSALPFIGLFGLTEFATRLPSVLYGVGTVWALYLLLENLFGKPVAFAGALLLAISPWHSHVSRLALDPVAFPFFFILGMYLLIKFRENPNFLILGAVASAITLYTYAVAKLFVPLLLGVFLLLYFGEIRKHLKHAFISFAILIALSIPVLSFSFLGEGQAHFNDISLFSDKAYPSLAMGFLQNYSFLPGDSNLAQSKVLVQAGTFLSNYLGHFSPRFLFFEGDGLDRHGLEGYGKLYIFEIPLLLTGCFVCLKERKKGQFLLLGWVLAFPLASSLTIETPMPHTLRSLIGAPALHTLSAIGLVYLLTKFGILTTRGLVLDWNSDRRTRIGGFAATGFLLLAVFITATYFRDYFTLYPTQSAQGWQYGMRSIIQYTESQKANYDEIVFSPGFNQPYIFLLFYTSYDPAKLQAQASHWITGEGLFGTLAGLDKYTFVDTDTRTAGDKRILYISYAYESLNVPAVWTISNPDRTLAARAMQLKY